MRWIMYDTKLFLSFREDIVSGGGGGGEKNKKH